MASTTTDQLAVNGGTPVRTDPWPARHLFGEEEKQAAIRLFDQCIETGGAIGYNGAEETAYCEEFAAYMGGGFADAVNSGSSALYVALRALELPAGSEVICPPITDPGGIMPVVMAGCVPVVADSEVCSYNVCAETIAARITDKTSAIVVAHIAGLACDMDPIVALAKKHNLRLIEDCAQCHGATYHGRKLGTFGEIAAFSTMSGKHHATGPQGGVVFTADEALYIKARHASDRGKPFGIENPAGNVMTSLNLNNNDLGCAIGRVQLKKLPWIVESRQKVAALIAEGLEQTQTTRLLRGAPDGEGSYWFLMPSVDTSKLSVDKATFVAALRAEGIPANTDYWHPVYRYPWMAEKIFFPGSTFPWGDAPVEFDIPNAEAAREHLFMIGFHERVGEQEAADVIAAIVKVEQAYLK